MFLVLRGLQRGVRRAIWTVLLTTLVAASLSSCGYGPQPGASAQPTQTPKASSFLRDFENGRWLEQEDPKLASSIKELGWIQDGIDGTESAAIQDLLYIAAVSRPVAASVVSLGWVRDGIDDLEVKAIEEVSYLAHEDAEAALRIVGMPFVETVEPPDISAIASLGQLAAYSPEMFESVMSHRTLRDGITNDLASIVATLRGVAETNPALIDVLLDPDRVLLERRTTTLPLSGDVVLFIIRTGPGAVRSMELLEHSVRSVEAYMGAPLPTNYVGLLYENAVSGSNEGENSGTHIAVLPSYDVDDGSHEATLAGSVIAHEVAHYYWSGNADWVG